MKANLHPWVLVEHPSTLSAAPFNCHWLCQGSLDGQVPLKKYKKSCFKTVETSLIYLSLDLSKKHPMRRSIPVKKSAPIEVPTKLKSKKHKPFSILLGVFPFISLQERFLDQSSFHYLRRSSISISSLLLNLLLKAAVSRNSAET